MKEKYNEVAVPKEGAAIECDVPVSQGKTPPFAQDAKDGAPEKASPARFLMMTKMEQADSNAENR